MQKEPIFQEYPKIRPFRISRRMGREDEEEIIINTDDNRFIILSQFGLELLHLLDGSRTIVELGEELQKTYDLENGIEFIQKFIEHFVIPQRLLLSEKESNEQNQSKKKKKSILSVNIESSGRMLRVVTSVSKPLKLLMGTRLSIILGILTFSLVLYFLISPIDTVESNLSNGYTILAVLLGIVLHELGHIAAALRCGIKPRKVGIKISFFFVGLYVDLTDAWALSRRSRVGIDIAGLYIQMIYTAVLVVYFELTNASWLLPALSLNILVLLFNFNILFPITDGYWVVSDGLEIPNLRSTALKSIFRLLKRMSLNRKDFFLLFYAIGSIFFLFSFILWVLMSFPVLLLQTIQLILLIFNASLENNLTAELIFSFLIGAFLTGMYGYILVLFLNSIFSSIFQKLRTAGPLRS